MPVTQITLLPGYDPDTQTRLVDHVTRAVRSVIPAAEAGTTTFIQEVSTYRRDGRVFQQGNAALPSASDVVRAFLQAMQARDLAQARTHLHPDFSMVFPGGHRFSELDEMIAWARPRYQRIAKTFEAFEESWQGDVTVVYCTGTLSGVWPNGEAFEGIRFVDRFEVRAGLLQRQHVWNDLGEHMRPA